MSAIFAVAVMNCSWTQVNRIVAGEAGLDQRLVRGDLHRVHVLDQHAVTGGPSPRSRLSPVSTGPMRDMSSVRTLVADVEPFDQGLVPMENLRRWCGTRRRLRAATSRARRQCTARRACCGAVALRENP